MCSKAQGIGLGDRVCHMMHVLLCYLLCEQSNTDQRLQEKANGPRATAVVSIATAASYNSWGVSEGSTCRHQLRCQLASSFQYLIRQVIDMFVRATASAARKNP